MSSEPMSANPTDQPLTEPTRAKRLSKLSEFLKSCRHRTKPETFDVLPIRPRRRTLGLSRVEVATLAEISVDWYTWLEQGRDIHPSAQVLDNLAAVFQLNKPERRYLYSLANYPCSPPEEPNADIRLIQKMIALMPSAPAIVLRKDWQILAQNECADEFFGRWELADEAKRNLLYLFFTDKTFTEYLRDWEWHARIVVRQFRTIYASEIGNPVFVSLVERLNRESSQFGNWWAEADVRGKDDGRKEFDHPLLGYRDYDYTIMRPAENQAIEILVFVPRTEC